MPTPITAQHLIKQFETLRSARQPLETIWREVESYMLPPALLPGKEGKTKQVLFDGTATLALERFAAVLDGLLTPKMQRWHGLTTTSATLNCDPEVAQWLEQVTSIVFEQRYRASSRFAAQLHEMYLSLGMYGTAVLCVEEYPKGNLCYRNIPLSEAYIAANAQGMIDTVFRVFEMPVSTWLERWPHMQSVLQSEPSTQEKQAMIRCLQVVMPAPSKPGQPVSYCSYDVSITHQCMMQTGRYRTMPYLVSRYLTVPGQVYGRSPAQSVLPDIKLLNEMEKTQLRMIHQQILPPLLVPEEGLTHPVTLSPGSINYGGIDAQGRVLIQPLSLPSDLQMSEQKMMQKRQLIHEAFLVNFFQVIVDNPKMTATEILQRAHEKAMLIAPTIGRQQHETLRPLIERELDLLHQQGALPPMPLAMNQASIDITYAGPMSRLQQAEQASGLLRMLDALAPFISYNPSLLEQFNLPCLMQQLAAAHGVSAHLLQPQGVQHG